MGKKHASQYANFGWLLIYIMSIIHITSVVSIKKIVGGLKL